MYSIFVCDDEDSITRIISKIFERCIDGKVYVAHDGDEAVKMMEVIPLDIVFLDIMMPKKSGFEVCKIIRRHNANVPIIAVTACISSTLEYDIIESGFSEVLLKPFDYDILIQYFQRNLCLKKQCWKGCFNDGDKIRK